MQKTKKLRTVADQMADKKTVPATADSKADIMKMANEVRSSANSLCDVKREDAFTHGMRLIYGGSSHIVAAKAGRP